MVFFSNISKRKRQKLQVMEIHLPLTIEASVITIGSAQASTNRKISKSLQCKRKSILVFFGIFPKILRNIPVFETTIAGRFANLR
jgi:hypothetical protein